MFLVDRIVSHKTGKITLATRERSVPVTSTAEVANYTTPIATATAVEAHLVQLVNVHVIPVAIVIIVVVANILIAVATMIDIAGTVV